MSNKQLNMKQGSAATLANLNRIQARESGEPMGKYKNPDIPLLARARDGQTVPNYIIVRETLAKKVEAAQKHLEKINKSYKLVVLEGLRSLKDQTEHFEKICQNLSKKWPQKTSSWIEEKAHMQIAEPTVAGHPTGGAIDVTIYENESELDFGGKAGDVDDPGTSSTWAKNINKSQLANRIMLRRVMMDQGLAPFNAEWWHFSYGDRDWAFFYGKAWAIYEIS